MRNDLTKTISYRKSISINLYLPQYLGQPGAFDTDLP